jgi:hypothetical protein
MKMPVKKFLINCPPPGPPASAFFSKRRFAWDRIVSFHRIFSLLRYYKLNKSLFLFVMLSIDGRGLNL